MPYAATIHNRPWYELERDPVLEEALAAIRATGMKVRQKYQNKAAAQGLADALGRHMGVTTAIRKIDREIPIVLTREQAAAILDVPNLFSPHGRGLRNRVILELMYRHGLRISEVVALAPRDVRLREGELWVRNSKRGKHRNLPIDKRSLPYLEGWMSVRPESAWFICSVQGYTRGKPVLSQSIDTTIRTIVRQAAKQHPELEIPVEDVTTHTFRHTCATEKLEEGWTLADVKELLGHASIVTTQIYTQVRPGRLRGLMERSAELALNGEA